MKEIDQMKVRIELLEEEIRAIANAENKLKNLLLSREKNYTTFIVIIKNVSDGTTEHFGKMSIDEIMELSSEMNNDQEMTITNDKGEIIYEE